MTIGLVMADDEPHALHVLNQMIPWDRLPLKLLGTAENGKDLVRLMEEKHPQIVITDIVMPGMSGLDVARKLLQKYPDTHFILMSAYADFDYARSALRLGLDDLLPKPVSASELSEALVKACREITGKTADGGLSVHMSSNPAIRRVMEYVTIHFREKLTLSDVADEVYMNPAYLSRLFKQETGGNFSDYLNQVRLEEAKRLLPDQSLTISEVAQLTGFGTTKYFSAIFRQKTGVTPSEYRKNMSGA